MEKYQKVTREDYRKWFREEEKLLGDGDYSRGNNRGHGWGCGGNFGGALGADLGGKTEREAGKGDPFRLAFHLMPDRGWLNDPNGLCQKDGIYHIYYQYDPFDCEGDLKLWGHFTTENFVEYKAWEPALFPDSEADAHGVYSGSAFVEDGTIHFFYTGNVKYFDRPDYDYITAGRGSNTIRVTSSDGFHFSGKQLLMTTADYPSDISCHVRDPKIIKRNGTYYMVLGARDLAGRGLVLVYHSADLERWEYHDRDVYKRHAWGTGENGM